jgi:hypothetical protein
LRDGAPSRAFRKEYRYFLLDKRYRHGDIVQNN